MRVPAIHINGTSRDDLLEQVCDAGQAVAKALRALEECAPNGRDYYIQGPSAITEAIAEHVARVKRLQSVHAELNTLAEAIADA